MTSSAAAWVVWQRWSVYKVWQEMTENTAETLSVKRDGVWMHLFGQIKAKVMHLKTLST